jgi:hypothetical protein
LTRGSARPGRSGITRNGGKASRGGATIYPTASTTAYRNTDGTGAETTSYAYTFFTNTNQIQSMTVTKPVISSTQNGPGVGPKASPPP